MIMLEKIARAMWEQRRRYCLQTIPEVGLLEEWGDGSIPISNGIMEEARAAVAALREPSEAMKAAITVMAWRSGVGQKPENICGAMIDAILNEKPE